MRIAVAGTHASGKSTLIADFLATHPEYAHEAEPYEWLDDPGLVGEHTALVEVSASPAQRLATLEAAVASSAAPGDVTRG
jgi:hypothetical protein